MQPETPVPESATEAHRVVESTYDDERWQGPSFAASWISPPRPRRALDDPSLPFRSDDHA